MQRSTDKSELAIRKQALTTLLKETREFHKHCEAARSAVENAKYLSMFYAWQAGIRLNKMKVIVGQGDWELWVKSNVPFSLRTAQLYMKIDNDNASLRLKAQRVAPDAPDLQLVKRLKFDTIRKYSIDLVPKKKRDQLEGDKKFPRSVSFLNIVNEFERVRQRHNTGQQEIDFDEAREETVVLYRFLRWLHGDCEEPRPPL